MASRTFTAFVTTSAGDCKVNYSSRRQVDGLIEQVRKTGRLEGVTFGQKRDPCDSLFRKMKSTFEPTTLRDVSRANVGVTIHANVPGISSKAGNLVSFTDHSVIKTHDPETLAPLGVIDQSMLHPSLNGPISCAHAQFDPQTGDLFNYNLDFGPNPTYRIFCTSAATGKTSILATFSGKDARPAYLHSFFLTANFVVLCIWPAYFVAGGSKILWTRNMLDALADFDPTAQTKWFVIDRRGGAGVVAKFKSPAMFAFHSINAYEEIADNGHVDIICDLVQYGTMDILKKFYYSNLVSTSTPDHYERVEGKDGVVRYKLAGIPTKGARKAMGKAEQVFIMPPSASGEFATINPANHTKKHHYVYGVCDRGQSSFLDGLVKMDMETQTSMLWSKAGNTPGEPIFVADPTRAEEDAGVVLSVVLDGMTGLSYLLVLDAVSWTEVGRAEVPTAVGFGFHGAHVKL